MSDKRIVICDLDHENVAPERAVLEKAGFGFDWLHCRTQEEVIENCTEAVVLMNQYVRMDRKIFEALPKLKCVVRYGVGVDNVNLEDADAFGIRVCNVPDYGTREVADQALAMMMCLTRKVAFTNSLIRKGIWDYLQKRSRFMEAAFWPSDRNGQISHLHEGGLSPRQLVDRNDRSFF